MMKRIVFILLATLAITASHAQNKPTDTEAKSGTDPRLQNNELRFNMLYAVLGMPEISYEYYIADNMGVGLSAAASIEKADKWEERYHFIPYYRLYFGNKKAAGFFIEGNMALARMERPGGYNFWGEYQDPAEGTSFGFGAGIGVKLMARNGFLGEIVGGATRLFNNPVASAIPRVGICIGKRF